MLSEQEGWHVKRPRWILNGDLDFEGTYGMAWGHSVFTHLPPQYIETIIKNAAKRLPPGASFCLRTSAAIKCSVPGLNNSCPSRLFASSPHGTASSASR